MKKLNFLLIALMALFILPACSDDDKDDDGGKTPPVPHEIVDTWAVSSINAQVNINNDNAIIVAAVEKIIKDLVTAGAADIKGLEIEFTNEDKVKIQGDNIGIYEIKDSRITFSDEVMSAIHPLMPSVLNFKIEENILTLTTDNMKETIMAGLAQAGNIPSYIDIENIGLEEVKIILTLRNENAPHEIVDTWAVSSIDAHVDIDNNNAIVVAAVEKIIKDLVTAGAADIKGLEIEFTNEEKVKIFGDNVGAYKIEGNRVTFSKEVMAAIHPLMPSELNFEIEDNTLILTTDNMKETIMAGLGQAGNIPSFIDIENIGLKEVKIILTLEK